MTPDHVDRRAAVAVGLGQLQVPDGAERVEFELVVVAAVAAGVEEDLEVVVVVKDVGVALDEGGLQVWLLEFGRDVQVLVVPQQLGAGRLNIVAADTLARTVAAPSEVPLGLITAAIGGPFLGWLLVSRRTT